MPAAEVGLPSAGSVQTQKGLARKSAANALGASLISV